MNLLTFSLSDHRCRRAQVVFDLAGLAAEALLDAEDMPSALDRLREQVQDIIDEGESLDDPGSDLAKALMLAEDIGVDIMDLLEPVLDVIHEEWDAVTAVAEALLTKRPYRGRRTLTGREVRRVLQGMERMAA